MVGDLATLDSHYDTYRRSSLYDDAMRRYTFKTFLPYLNRKDSVALELGCSDGLMTELISNEVGSLDVVDGSERFLNEAKKRNLKNATFSHCLFENYKPQRKYDFIFATFVLTHIPDVSIFFENVSTWLEEDGILFVAVPNCRVLSRQLALHMGLLGSLNGLSDNDKAHGHFRSYDRVGLNRDLVSGGFLVIHQGGILLKPLADFQMDALILNDVIGEQQLEGLYKLGLEYPDLSAVIFSISKKSQN